MIAGAIAIALGVIYGGGKQRSSGGAKVGKGRRVGYMCERINL